MKKILIIEDNNELRDSVKDFLEAEDYEVVEASDGMEGLHKAKELIPDLIICDIMMPKLDGYKVISSLKQNNSTSLIPFIFLTSKAERTAQREGMELGADDYLTKPFTRDELLRAINTASEKRQKLIEQLSMEVNKNSSGEFVMLRIANKPMLVRINDIKVISANGDYSEVIIENNNKSLVLRSLREWEEKLPSNFLRVHRSVIINLNFVEKLEDWSNYTYHVRLKGIEEPFTVSQKYSNELRKKFT